MNSISVYGYHPDMLATFDASLSTKDVLKDKENVRDPHRWNDQPTGCPLLGLPYELRAQIYSYVLPSTSNEPILGITWRRATAPMWATCRKVYHECIDRLYSDCTFDIDVKFDCVIFHHQYSRGQLTLRRNFNFPEIIPARNVDLLRRVHVRVHEVDSYMGMINFNYSNTIGLAMGVSTQVQKLCDVLRGVPEIRDLQVTYTGYSDQSAKLMPCILAPFHVLKNTRAVTFVGFDSFEGDYAIQLLRRLTNAYTRNSILSLPSNIRADIYRHVLPYRTCSMINGIKKDIWHPGDASIKRTCKSIYEETNHLLHGLSESESLSC